MICSIYLRYLLGHLVCFLSIILSTGELASIEQAHDDVRGVQEELRGAAGGRGEEYYPAD